MTKVKKKTLLVTLFLAILRYKLLNQPVILKTNNKKAILLIINVKFHCYINYIKI